MEIRRKDKHRKTTGQGKCGFRKAVRKTWGWKEYGSRKNGHAVVGTEQSNSASGNITAPTASTKIRAILDNLA